MLTLRKADDRGHTDFGWLNSRHSFSFGEYHDAAHMGFGPLRVINDDRVSQGSGFPAHAHADMEIITYVLDGALEHKDSLGTGSVIKPGDVQRMSAGTGIRHSEFNASKTEPVHFLQVWILPKQRGLQPSYEQKSFAEHDTRGKLRLIGAKDGRDGAVTIHQDVDLYVAKLALADTVTHDIKPERTAWLHIATGRAVVNGLPVEAGDGIAVTGEDALHIEGQGPGAEVLLFDLAA